MNGCPCGSTKAGPSSTRPPKCGIRRRYWESPTLKTSCCSGKINCYPCLTVDHNSPYYHEENQGYIFYAESWALTHYLTIKDEQDKTDRLTTYVKLVSDNVDSVTAAARAFGDLKILEGRLNEYIAQRKFYYFKMPGSTDVNDTPFQVRSVTPVQADAIRADFLVYIQRPKDARVLLDRVLKDEPNNI